jgi:hypothetical protein
MPLSLWDQIVRDIERAYGSTSSPNWSFVLREHERDPYGELLAALATAVTVTDKTDLNEDVSLYLILGPLASDSFSWSLGLSYVGRYAVFYRHGGPVLTKATPGLSAEESRILEILDSHGVQALEGSLLVRPFPMPGFSNHPDPQDVRIYHALFSDLEILPWLFGEPKE